MAKLLMAFMVVLSINVILFLGQYSATQINPDGATAYYNCKGSILNKITNSNEECKEVLDDPSLLSDKLPSGAESVDVSNGNIFTDVFSTMIKWLLDLPIISTVMGVLSAPYNFLKAIGLPQVFVFAIGSLWYLGSLLIVIMFLKGSD